MAETVKDAAFEAIRKLELEWSRREGDENAQGDTWDGRSNGQVVATVAVFYTGGGADPGFGFKALVSSIQLGFTHTVHRRDRENALGAAKFTATELVRDRLCSAFSCPAAAGALRAVHRVGYSEGYDASQADAVDGMSG